MGSAYVDQALPMLETVTDTRVVTDAFIRDELSKGRYDPAISKICFEMLLELFNRTLKLDLGERSTETRKVEDVC